MVHEPRFNVALAGAGTGKTYSLVENYLDALFGFDENGIRKRPQEIVALTFTEKAAHEMRLRIVKKLSSLIMPGSEDYVAISMKARDLNVLAPTLDEIKRILRAMPNASIATFHGFCSSFLRKEAHTLLLDDGFSIMSPKDELYHARNILRPLIMSHIEHDDSPVRSLLARFRLKSGLMSLGLLDGLLDLYFRLPEKGIDAYDIDSGSPEWCDTKLSIDDIEAALHHFISLQASPGTKHKLLMIKELWADVKHSLLSHDEQEVSRAFVAIRGAIKGNFGDKDARSALVTAVVKFGARLVDRFLRADEQVVARLIAEFHQSFMDFKNQANLVSYSDLLFKTKSALRDNLVLRKRIKGTIKHLLVDEYQDTSPIQEDLVALLLENRTHESTLPTSGCMLDYIDMRQGPSLFVVGDKKQSIYGFRGADSSLFDHLINKLQEQAKDKFSMRLLTINRRSSKNVIELINLVAKATLYDQGYRPEHALESFCDSEGRCALWVKPALGLDKTQANLAGAALGIAHLLQGRSDLSAKDIVVLVRRIKSASVIKEHLLRFGVAARIVGGDGFFQQQEVVDLLSALKLVVDPGAEMAACIVLRSPLVLLLDQELLHIKLTFGSITLHNAMLALQAGGLGDSSAQRLVSFVNALDMAKAALLEHGLAHALDIVVDQTRYVYALGVGDNAHQKWANLKKLRVVALKSNKNPLVAIDELYHRIKDDEKEPLAETLRDNNAVTIMTIHQSKGLEFKVVVVADGESSMPQNRGDLLADKNFGFAMRPKNRAISRALPRGSDKLLAATRFDLINDAINNREQQEMARLLYVAMTRAKEELYVVSTDASLLAEHKNLVGLFVRAFRQSKDQFLAHCDVIEIKDFLGTLNKEESVVVDEAALFQPATYKKRLFASAIEVDDAFYVPWVQPGLKAPKHSLDGDLAHKLLAQGGRGILMNPQDDVGEFLEATLRFMGLSRHEKTKPTLEAVIVTLKLLKKNLPNDAELIFEMPLISHPHDSLVVEGFADMVVLAKDFVGVMEFKSTLTAAKAKTSYAQVLAYAHALSSQFNGPIYFGVKLIGSSLDIVWSEFDDQARHEFLRLMSNQGWY